ncbi:hypothetical protein PIB30_046337 [Stylosanthes scabra]|uniref:Uncharacterized protein n=1 Tax=Stylosanthes scabra TaxID=79078 RepID=A0ABU6VID2_9FABA|nr:hypothetical protein [Stylosanthes scabra]
MNDIVIEKTSTKERKIGDFPGCSFISPHKFYYFISYFTIQRDSVITLMETSPLTVPIPEVPDPLFFACVSIPLRNNQQSLGIGMLHIGALGAYALAPFSTLGVPPKASRCVRIGPLVHMQGLQNWPSRFSLRSSRSFRPF